MVQEAAKIAYFFQFNMFYLVEKNVVISSSVFDESEGGGEFRTMKKGV